MTPYWTADGKEVIYEAGWSDWEEGQQITVYEKDGKLYSNHSGYMVYCGDFDDTEEITFAEALEIVDEWKEHYDD